MMKADRSRIGLSVVMLHIPVHGFHLHFPQPVEKSLKSNYLKKMYVLGCFKSPYRSNNPSLI